jgi:hypothetical protein
MHRLLATLCLILPLAANGEVKLINKDSRSHDLTVKCSTTVQRSLSGNTTTSLGKGPCEVKVKTTGNSMKVGDGATLTIKDGRLTRR